MADDKRKRHEDAINNQKAALRDGADPATHARATAASHAAANDSIAEQTKNWQRDSHGIAIDPHYDPNRPKMKPNTFMGNVRRQAGQAAEWSKAARFLVTGKR